MGTLEQYTPRYFEQIFTDMVNIIRTICPTLTDFNIGSRVRTILEIAALEDDEQFHQITSLLLLNKLDNLRGKDLDERLTEWNVYRLSALAAHGYVIVSNSNLVTTFSSVALPVLSGSMTVRSSAGFPTSFPFTIRIGEGTINVEDVAVSANNTTSGVLTFVAATTKAHERNERVSLVSGLALVTPAGQRVRVRGTSTGFEITGTLLEDARIVAGNYDSNRARVVIDVAGIIGRVAKGAFKEFLGTAPFDGALVRNDAAFTGGRDEESDDEFRSRGRLKIQSLARSTILALEQLVLGIDFTGTDGATWRVISSKAKEFFGHDGNDWVELYIWPGAFDFISSEVTTSIEILTVNAEDGQKFFNLPHNAIIPNSLYLEYYPANGIAWEPLTQGVHYFLNEGTGQIEIIDPSLLVVSSVGPIVSVGLSKGDQLRATQYRYYTGLIQQVQSAVNGVVRNPTVYPGIAAAGIKVLVSSPIARKINDIRAAIQVNAGYAESSVAPFVVDAISRYLTELSVGDDIILAELVQRAMEVDGMYNVQFSSPTQDIVLMEDEIIDMEDLDIFVS